MDLPLYTYEPLQSERRFRLLELEKSSGSEPGPLRATLREESVDESPGYVGLSYVWGSPDFVESIEIEGQRLPITTSLSQALRAVQPILGTLDWPSLIWADAACINQADVEERAAQVRLMRHIYENANIVFAWLGPRPPVTEGFIALMGIFKCINLYLSKLIDSNGRALDGEQIKTLFRATTDLLLNDPNGLLNPQTRAAIEDFYARPWWNRAWIVQEATGVNTVLLSMGESTVTLSQAMNLSRFLHFLRTHPGIDGYDPAYLRGMALLNMLQHRQAGRVKRMDTLLQSFRDRKATDARDKVYCAMSVIQDESLRDFKVKYTPGHTAGEVYHELALYLLEVSERLEFLGSDNRPPSGIDADLPSWIPDWRYPSKALDLDKFWNPLNAGVKDENNLIYSADLELPQGFTTVAHHELRAGGVCLDTISQVQAHALESHSDLTAERSWCPSEGNNLYEATGETEFDAYLRTLVADLANTPGGAHELARGQKMDWAILSAPSLHEHLKDASPAVWMDSVNLLDRLKTVTMNRRFARTDTLRLMGLVPIYASVGDTICVVAGCSVPLVVRSGSQRRWRLVGQAYVHGLMDGMAHELVQKNQRALKTMTFE